MLLKLCSAETIQWMKATANIIWKVEQVPEDWQKHFPIPLYHGIALLTIPSKVFAKALLIRVMSRVKLLLIQSQCSFHQVRGCADQLFS